jgi:hypothetical protein
MTVKGALLRSKKPKKHKIGKSYVEQLKHLKLENMKKDKERNILRIQSKLNVIFSPI